MEFFQDLTIAKPFRAKPKPPEGDVEDLRLQEEHAFLDSCRPSLDALEKIRLLKQRVYELRKKIAYPLAAVGVPVCAYLDYLILWWQRSNDDSAAGLTFLFLGVLYWWVTAPKREYAKAYKVEILPQIAKLFGNFFYDVDGKIPMSAMLPSKIVPGHDKYGSEDYFKGTYKGVDVEFSEIILTETQGSGDKKRTVTKFKGLAILLAMQSKKFYGHTILDKNKSGLGEWFQEKSTKMKRARMADPEFEKIFDAYTTDQVEARYLIDPVMIERLKNLFDEYTADDERARMEPDPSWIERFKGMAARLRSQGTQSLTAAFYENKLLILIGSKHNHFEPADIHIPATDPQSILHLKREIGDILALIERLNLYDPRKVHEEAAA